MIIEYLFIEIFFIGVLVVEVFGDFKDKNLFLRGEIFLFFIEFKVCWFLKIMKFVRKGRKRFKWL